MARLTGTILRQAHHQNRQLFVQLASGVWYRYDGVDERVYMELVTAASPGRYWNAEVRGCYEGAKVSNPR